LGGFYLREDSDRPLILMAGGTGFAPLKSIVEHSIHTEDRRTVHLYWGARARNDLYLDALARRWAEQLPRLRYEPVLSEPRADEHWQGRTGFVHQAVCDDHPDLSGFDVYMSGPPAMVAAARQSFAARGLPDDQLFFDVFDYSADTLDALGRR
jgi:CDP-4-dehydro-6-deoxyglucose reductase